MKLFAFIMPLALLTASATFAAEEDLADAPAATYPEIPALADLIAAQTAVADSFPEIKDPGDPAQIANAAPLLAVADLPMAGDPITLAQSVQPSAIASLSATGDPVALADTVKPPALAPVKETGDPVALSVTVNLPSVTALAEPTVPDLFTINRLFNWDNPHGQWMNQMTKDIEAARKAGDMETYDTLTARYTAWAEKYLRRESPPKLDGNPGH